MTLMSRVGWGLYLADAALLLHDMSLILVKAVM
jgi:hypothetical protein